MLLYHHLSLSPHKPFSTPYSIHSTRLYLHSNAPRSMLIRLSKWPALVAALSLSLQSVGADRELFQNTEVIANIAECTSYPSNGICSPYISYNVQLPNATTDASVLDRRLDSLNLTLLQTFFSPTQTQCIDSLFSWICSSAYPKCDSTSTTPPCKTSCTNVRQQCSHLYDLMQLSVLSPDCSASAPISNIPYSSDASCRTANITANTTVSTILVPAMQPKISCPSPFLPIEQGKEDYTVHSRGICLAGCCLPTPILRNFYKAQDFDNLYAKLSIIADISCVFLVLWLLVITFTPKSPYKRYPAFQIYFLLCAMLLWFISFLIGQGMPNFGNLKFTSTIPANQDNNVACAAQGSLFYFGLHAVPLWASMIMLDLHLNLIWGNRFFAKRVWVMHLICWGIPAVFLVVALSLGHIGSEISQLCFLNVAYMRPLMLWPVVAYAAPTFIFAHFTALIYMARGTLRSSSARDKHSTYTTYNAQTSLDAISTLGTAFNATPHMGEINKQQTPSSKKRRTLHIDDLKPKGKQVIQVFRLQLRYLVLGFLFAVLAIYLLTFFFVHQKDYPVSPSTMNPAGSLSSEWIACLLMQTNNYISPGGNPDICADISGAPPWKQFAAMEILAGLIGILAVPTFCRPEVFFEFRDWIKSGCPFRDHSDDDSAAKARRRSRLQKSGVETTSKPSTEIMGLAISMNDLEDGGVGMNSKSPPSTATSRKMHRYENADMRRGQYDSDEDNSSDEEDDTVHAPSPMPIVDSQGRILALDMDAAGLRDVPQRKSSVKSGERTNRRGSTVHEGPIDAPRKGSVASLGSPYERLDAIRRRTADAVADTPASTDARPELSPIDKAWLSQRTMVSRNSSKSGTSMSRSNSRRLSDQHPPQRRVSGSNRGAASVPTTPTASSVPYGATAAFPQGYAGPASPPPRRRKSHDINALAITVPPPISSQTITTPPIPSQTITTPTLPSRGVPSPKSPRDFPSWLASNYTSPPLPPPNSPPPPTPKSPHRPLYSPHAPTPL